MGADDAKPSAPALPATLQVQPGDLLAGKYRVERVLGVGGMGVVVAARHEELGRRVALKILRPEVAGGAEVLPRFLQEARAAAQIESDHIARVFDVGTIGAGYAYMAMEHLEGHDLEAVLARDGALPVAEAVDHVIEALDAVAHAHAIGVVHRDLKPGNLFRELRPDGTTRIKVLDFGISKSSSGLDAEGVSITQTSPQAIMGSPAYMSPEQVRSSKSVDPRSDIWSIGIILFELLTGAKPFEGDTVGEVFARILELDAPSVRQKRREVPSALDAVVKRCLARDRDQRYPSVAELAAALAPHGTAKTKALPARIAGVLRGAVSRRPGMASQTDGTSLPDVDPSGASLDDEIARLRPPAARRRAVIAIGGVAAVAIAVGVGVLAESGGEPGAPAGAAASAPDPAPQRASAAPTAPEPAATTPAAPSAAPDASAAPAAPATSAATAPSAAAQRRGKGPGPADKPAAPAGKAKSAYPAKLFEGRD
jgi:serine/threonine-protein kinase